MIAEFRSEPLLYGSLAGLGLLVVLAGTYAMVQDEGPAPPPPPPPPPVEKTTVQHLRFTEGYYRALLAEDARKFGLEKFAPDELLAPNRYEPEFRGSQVLTEKRPALSTDHLKISVRSERIRVGEIDSGYSAEHILLRVENRTDKHLAYAVETKLTDAKGCAGKGDMAHNAIGLRPHETVDRTECLYAKWNEVHVVRVDVMELTALGYFYVSRLSPMQLGEDPRIGSGHVVPGGAEVCQHVPGREVRDGLIARTTRWEDVMDFYARHNCDEYWFFAGYRMQEQPLARLLPAQEPAAPQAPAAPAPASPPPP
jgi:hypothetical protein